MRLIFFGWFIFGKMWKNMEKRPFFGRVRPDWGNTARVAMARLGSKGLTRKIVLLSLSPIYLAYSNSCS